MSNARVTSRTIQVAVRLPKELYAAMQRRPAPIARQIIQALERELATPLAKASASRAHTG